MNEIILIGGGGHCKSVIDVIEQEGRFEIVGIVDKPKLLGSNVLGYSVIGSDFDLDSLAKRYQYALITVGQIKSPSLRIKLFNKAVEAGFIMQLSPIDALALTIALCITTVPLPIDEYLDI